MVKLDNLDTAPLNDEALGRQQKLYSERRFTTYKAYLSSYPWAQKLPGDIAVDAGLLCNKATIHQSPIIVFTLKSNTLYMPCWHTSPSTTQSMSSSAGKRIPILRGLKFIIFSNVSSRICWSDSSWSRLKHLLNYKTPRAANEKGMRGRHQSLALKNHLILLIFRRE